MATTPAPRRRNKRPQGPTGLTQAERSEGTISGLVATARGLFAERGFAHTSIEEIVRAAGVTRGALYHHFDGKTAVFRAVFENEVRALAERTAAAGLRRRDPWRQVEAGCLEFLDASRDPGVQRIVLIDAMSVLGWEALREIEGRHTLALLMQGLENAMEAGKLRRRPVAPLAHLLFGAMCEASMVAARDADPDRAMRDVRKEVHDLLRTVARS